MSFNILKNKVIFNFLGTIITILGVFFLFGACGNSIVIGPGPELKSEGGVQKERLAVEEEEILPEKKPEAIQEQKRIDESFCCQNGEKRPCYTGNPKTRGKGTCKVGFQVCQHCIWSKCQGEILPTYEICSDHLDNDCDGVIDEKDCRCREGTTRTCGVARKPCKLGRQRCVNGRWGRCVSGILPKKEGCDGVDNDCDGQIDEGNPGGGSPCRVPGARGVCQLGITRCVKAALTCVPKYRPTTEICDHKDNDCDGQIDEGNVCSSPQCRPGQTSGCYTGPKATMGKGICKIGKRRCLPNGHWSPKCEGEVLPKKEICNKKDDNCDGRVDEGGVCGCKVGAKRSCYTASSGKPGMGICKAGLQTCLSNHRWGPCQGQITPQWEKCDNRDNDCDGQIDEGIYRPCYGGNPRLRGVGACQDGRTYCKNGRWGKCIGYGVPKAEICDSIDNDCDGSIDEGNVCVKPGHGPVFRMNTFAIAKSTEGFDLNGDGKIDNSLAILGTFLNKSLAQSVQKGSLNILLELAKMADPKGQNGAATIYLYMGKRASRGYLGERSSLDAQGRPLFRFAGLFRSYVLKAGPGVANLSLPLFGSTNSIFRLEKAYITFRNVALKELRNGYLAGAIPASYLDRIPADKIPIFGGPGKTLLDVLVNLGKQPDVDLDNDGLERFRATKQTISSCQDGNGTIITGGNCALNSRFKDGYSITFKFTARRITFLGFTR